MGSAPPPLMPAADSNWNLIGCLIPIVLAGVLVYNCSGTREERTAAQLGTDAVTAVKARLRDPSSASFDQLYARGTAYCGKVNAANGVGGKSGWQRFVYSDGKPLIEEDGEVFRSAWARHCA